MPKREIVWVIVSTNSLKEADIIGMACLKRRLCACYGIIPRLKSVYFWPPRLPNKRASRGGTKFNKLETSKGPLLIVESLEKHYAKITKLVKLLHSDKIPFIGRCKIQAVEKIFFSWLKTEVS